MLTESFPPLDKLPIFPNLTLQSTKYNNSILISNLHLLLVPLGPFTLVGFSLAYTSLRPRVLCTTSNHAVTSSNFGRILAETRLPKY